MFDRNLDIKLITKICVFIIYGSIMILGLVSLINLTTVVTGKPKMDDNRIKEMWNLVEEPNSTEMIGSFIASLFLVLIGALGCCGIVLQTKWLTIENYMVLITGIVLLAIFAVMIKNRISNSRLKIRDKMVRLMSMYEPVNKARRLMDAIQETYKCCGIDTYVDWIEIIGYVPHSCCSTNTSVSVHCQEHEVKVIRGCYEPFENITASRWGIILFVDTAISLPVGSIVIFGILFWFFEGIDFY